MRILLLAITFLFMGHSAFAQDLVSIPELTGPVVDRVGVLTSEENQRISNIILNLQKETGGQIQVLILDSTKPESIDQYSIRVAEEWKIGRKNVDDGVIFIAAIQDRMMRIEVGYGLEGAIPDIMANRIRTDIITPHFRSENYGKGIEEGVLALASLIRGEDLPIPEDDYDSYNSGNSISDSGDDSGSGWVSFIYVIAIVLALISRVVGSGVSTFFVLFVFLSIANILEGSGFFGGIGQGLFFAIFGTAFLYGRGGGGSGGGYSSGGGFSSGGGWSGGGGSFGGGGSSGSW